MGYLKVTEKKKKKKKKKKKNRPTRVKRSICHILSWKMGNSCGVHLHSSITISSKKLPISHSLKCSFPNKISFDIAKLAKSHDCTKSHDSPIWWI